MRTKPRQKYVKWIADKHFPHYYTNMAHVCHISTYMHVIVGRLKEALEKRLYSAFQSISHFIEFFSLLFCLPGFLFV